MESHRRLTYCKQYRGFLASEFSHYIEELSLISGTLQKPNVDRDCGCRHHWSVSHLIPPLSLHQTCKLLMTNYLSRTTAYYLQELGCKEDIHLIEASQEPFSGASGYAAGFLAADWYSTSMLPLGRLSFALHKSLADENDGRKSWAYSGSTGISLGPSLSTSNDECNSDDGDQEEIENGVDWLLQGTSRAQVAARNDRSRNELDDDDNEAPAWLRVHDNQDCEILSRGESTGQVYVKPVEQ